MEESATATVDVATAAGILGVNKHTIYEAVKRGDQPFPVIRLGDRILIPRAALERLLEDDDELNDAALDRAVAVLLRAMPAASETAERDRPRQGGLLNAEQPALALAKARAARKAAP